MQAGALGRPKSKSGYRRLELPGWAVAMLRRLGIAAGAPLFIPGVGALVMLKEHVTDPIVDARIGLAGACAANVMAIAFALYGGVRFIGGVAEEAVAKEAKAAADLKAEGAMTVLLAQALAPRGRPYEDGAHGVGGVVAQGEH